tara:strand:- start:416 stop:1351 length:936 start_codon:yes stop_codon:yes gene_type:complete
MKNFRFFGNHFNPPGADYIENILKWDNHKLEVCHCYIQWLFPVDDEVSKFNYHSQLITEQESELICKNVKCSLRVIHSYDKMLCFWGFRLCHNTWKVCVGDEKRLDFLNTSTHNFLRITRVLKSMPLLGLLTLRPSFIQALCEQVLNGRLCNAYESMIKYWLPLSLLSKSCSENLALSILMRSNEFGQINILSQVVCSSNCGYAKKLLKHFSMKVADDLPKSVWLIVGEKEDNYILMGMHTLKMKLAKKDFVRFKFSFFLSYPGVDLDTWDYKGLWLYDACSDIQDNEICRVVSKSYVSGQKLISFVFLIK